MTQMVARKSLCQIILKHSYKSDFFTMQFIIENYSPDLFIYCSLKEKPHLPNFSFLFFSIYWQILETTQTKILNAISKYFAL